MRVIQSSETDRTSMSDDYSEFDLIRLIDFGDASIEIGIEFF